MILDFASSILGLIIPPAFDFIKKKFLKPSLNSPEATLSSLATTNPEIIDKYIMAIAQLLDSKTKYYNRDVIGNPSNWVINLRASIRPIFTIISLILIFSSVAFNWNIDQSIKSILEISITSWFGSRICN